jgi:hypothetical protein
LFDGLTREFGSGFHAGMRCTVELRVANGLNVSSADGRRRGGLKFAASVAASFVLLLAGCMGSLPKHTAAVAAAAAPVIDEAEAAYAGANKIHDLRVDYDAVTEFDKKDTVYNPRTIQPLLTPAQMDVRLAVLKGLQTYVQTLVAVTGDADSPALDEASKSLGGGLTVLANSAAPAIESGLGIADPATWTSSTTVTTGSGNTSTSISSPATNVAAPLIQGGTQKVLTVGVKALGEYLGAKKVKQELPRIVEKMDPQIESLCKLLADELDILASQEKIDFDSIILRQRLFLTTATLDAQERREQIMKLPELVRQERAAQANLAQLKAGLLGLELTHHALAAEAQGNNPESFKNKLADVEAAGKNLGKFYSSL